MADLQEKFLAISKKGDVKLKRLQLGDPAEYCRLTQREAEVLSYMMVGCTAKETAKKLGLSFRTVESYIENIKNKLKCSRRGEIMGFIIKNKYLDQLLASSTINFQ